jgi:putative transposase
MNQRRELIANEHVLSIRSQCQVLSIHRSGLYYKPQGESQDNLKIMRLMDEHFLNHPSEGVLRM